MALEAKKKIKPHHIGIAAVLSSFPGYYGIRHAADFFYTRREAVIELQYIKEGVHDLREENMEIKKELITELRELNTRISRIEGFMREQTSLLKTKKDGSFGLEEWKKEKSKQQGG